MTDAAILDLSNVSEPTVRALAQIGVTLGWKVSARRNQPVIFVAKDGTSKNLPTNSTIKFGVTSANIFKPIDPSGALNTR